jgi:hypothetical protein
LYAQASRSSLYDTAYSAEVLEVLLPAIVQPPHGKLDLPMKVFIEYIDDPVDQFLVDFHLLSSDL